MCGIAGIFHHSTVDDRVDAAVLARMSAALAHRGPDGHGVWMSPDRRIGLAHRRLAIVEPGQTAAQPMANEDGRVVVSFNGEIYNHAALRPLLASRGHRFRTDHADTEVIVHAFEEWGSGCVGRLEGEFAFAVADAARGRLLLVRDRLGVKPLYFTLAPGLLLFASEIKALLRHPAVSPAVSDAALYHYLTFLTAPAPLTMFDGIYKLPAGSMLTIDGNGTTAIDRYWDPLPPSRHRHRELAGLSPSAQEEFCVRGVRSRLDMAVEDRLMSDVPFGVLLSGGLDSSINVALMSRHMSSPVRTFTVGYRDHSRTNEFEHARRIARLFGTDHHEVQIDARAALGYLPSLIEDQDEPLADWVCIPLHFVSKLARDAGTPVVHVGEGSDEQFCGYTHYMRYLELHRIERQFRRLPTVLQRSLAAAVDLGSRGTGRGSFYADAATRAARQREIFWGGAVAFWERDKRRLAVRERFGRPARDVPDSLRAILPSSFHGADSFGVVSAYREEAERGFPDIDFFTWMTYLECRLRLPELLLMRADKITMSVSVEARVPFLDHRLVEFVMGVPEEIKVKNGVQKHLLKRAAADLLPDEVIHRPKMGFNAPMAEWLRGGLGAHVRATVMDSPMRRERYFDYDQIARLFARHEAGHDASLPLWTLYNVSAWFDRWIAGTAAAGC